MGKTTEKQAPAAAAEQAAAPEAKRQVTVVPQSGTAKPLRTPDEWGMLAVKVKTIVEEETRPDGKKIRRSRLECKELDEAVLMRKHCDYSTYDSNGIEHYHQVEPKTVFMPPNMVEKKKAQGYEIVENAPDWRHFKPRAE